MSNRWVRSNLTPLALAVAGIVCAAAAAQEAPAAAAAVSSQAKGLTLEGQIQEAVVTAQCTTSAESKTPVAMSVVDGAALAAAGIDPPSDIGTRLPGVAISGAADGLNIAIR